MKKPTKQYNKELNTWIKYYEDFDPRRKNHDLYAIASRIAWYWKFRKITREEMENFCDRVIALFENKNSSYNMD